MRIIMLACLVAFAFSAPAGAVTVANGVVMFNQADAIAGGVSPGDNPGFPVTISAPGVYRLSGNLAPTANVNGIEVTAPEVTIDFFGFRMAGSGTAVRGIDAGGRALSVMNGTIRGFKNFGILANQTQLVVTNMRISDSVFGIAENLGSGSTIRNSTIFNNTSYGISCVANCHVESNNISRNGVGVYFSSLGGTALGNNIYKNGTGVRIDSGDVSLGKNAILGNTTSVLGLFTAVSPNACNPGC